METQENRIPTPGFKFYSFNDFFFDYYLKTEEELRDKSNQQNHSRA
jgi:hypothetical protein